MGNNEPENLRLEKLNTFICELRDVLNELCLDLVETEDENIKLIVSQCLDKVIIEYMNEISSYSK